MTIYEFMSLIVVGALWGCTNGFLRQPEAPPKLLKEKGSFAQEVVYKITSLFTNWRFVLPFTINQSGSLLYYFLLGSTELSLAVPISNGSTFVFTYITALIRGESSGGNQPLMWTGVCLVVIGVTLMQHK